MRKLLFVDIPIAEPCTVVHPLSKPSIVHYKAFDTDRSRLFSQRDLSGLIEMECGCLPRVINHRPKARIGSIRNNGVDLKTMHQTRCASNALTGKTGKELRRLNPFAFLEAIPKIEGVQPAGDVHLLKRILLDADLPRSTPRQRAEVGIPLFLILRDVAIDDEERDVLRAGSSAPALQHDLASTNGLVLNTPFSSPTARQEVQPAAACSIVKAASDRFS